MNDSLFEQAVENEIEVKGPWDVVWPMAMRRAEALRHKRGAPVPLAELREIIKQVDAEVAAQGAGTELSE